LIKSFFLILKPTVFTEITLPSLDIKAKAFSNLSSLPFSITPILAEKLNVTIINRKIIFDKIMTSF